MMRKLMICPACETFNAISNTIPNSRQQGLGHLRGKGFGALAWYYRERGWTWRQPRFQCLPCLSLDPGRPPSSFSGCTLHMQANCDGDLHAVGSAVSSHPYCGWKL